MTDKFQAKIVDCEGNRIGVTSGDIEYLSIWTKQIRENLKRNTSGFIGHIIVSPFINGKPNSKYSSSTEIRL